MNFLVLFLTILGLEAGVIAIICSTNIQDIEDQCCGLINKNMGLIFDRMQIIYLALDSLKKNSYLLGETISGKGSLRCK